MKRFSEALKFASDLHQDQYRKGSTIPYVSHLMHVSAFVWEFGGDEDQAIAGLLHDAIEDQGDKISIEEIANKFGDKVAGIVHACTDSWSEPRPTWDERKQTYVTELKNKDAYVKLVVACDKYHNLTAIVRDMEQFGHDYLDRFSAPPEKLLWYYEEISKALSDLNSPVVKLFNKKLQSFRGLINASA